MEMQDKIRIFIYYKFISKLKNKIDRLLEWE